MNHLIRAIRPKSLNRRQARYRQEHESCVLCDTPLTLRFEPVEVSDGNRRMVREIAECPSCRIRARSIEHKVQ
jgi:hypothetical protein